MFRLEVANYGLATCLDQTIDLTSMQFEDTRIEGTPLMMSSRAEMLRCYLTPEVVSRSYVTSSILSNVNIAAS